MLAFYLLSRDPEFIFYDGSEYKMSAFSVKPAVFDLFLALAIGGYLAAIYFIVQVILRWYCKTFLIAYLGSSSCTCLWFYSQP